MACSTGVSSTSTMMAEQTRAMLLQALKDMDTDTLRKLLGDVNLPSWINFPGELNQSAVFAQHSLW